MSAVYPVLSLRRKGMFWQAKDRLWGKHEELQAFHFHSDAASSLSRPFLVLPNQEAIPLDDSDWQPFEMPNASALVK